ncbi:MAG: branched-chain amino acid aminotransferase [Bacteroidota bacterium]|nr:branched-chain amino acid aminotransferase [Bacteroidota bacterium]
MTETLSIHIEHNKYSTFDKVDFNNLDFGKYHSDHMYVVDFNNETWHDQRIVPYQNISISPATAALHYGQTVFEGFKAHKSKKNNDVLIFRPEKHWERMNKSLERLCMPSIPKDIFMDGVVELARTDRKWVPTSEGSSLYFRPFAFAMDAFIRVKPSENYFFIVFCSPVGAYFSGKLKVKVETSFVRSAEGGIGFSKSGGNYAASLLPAKKAAAEGYQQIMWTDAKEHKYIEETGASNVMFVIDNVLITPELSSSILAGVTRDSILTIAREWGVKVEERKISIEEIVLAHKNKTLQEAFGTGTAAVISPINAINYQGVDYNIPDVTEKSFATKMLKALNDIKYGLVEDPYGWIVKV